MLFVLTGFAQDMGFRVFSFERIGEDRVRTRFAVRADLALVLKYGIRLQELPLLCRSFLERRDEADEKRALTFGEDEMRLYAKGCLAARDASAQRKKPARRPPSENTGAAWRGTSISSDPTH